MVEEDKIYQNNAEYENSECSKSKSYRQIVNLYSEHVYKICLLLLKDESKAASLTVKILADFYDVYESMIDLSVVKREKRIDRYLTYMILMSVKSNTRRANEKDYKD